MFLFLFEKTLPNVPMTFWNVFLRKIVYGSKKTYGNECFFDQKSRIYGKAIVVSSGVYILYE
jgi:hypothetical protein